MSLCWLLLLSVSLPGNDHGLLAAQLAGGVAAGRAGVRVGEAEGGSGGAEAAARGVGADGTVARAWALQQGRPQVVLQSGGSSPQLSLGLKPYQASTSSHARLAISWLANYRINFVFILVYIPLTDCNDQHLEYTGYVKDNLTKFPVFLSGKFHHKSFNHILLPLDPNLLAEPGSAQPVSFNHDLIFQ